MPMIRFGLTCIRAERCTVAFEPEGAQVVLREGDALVVEIAGPDEGPMEISYSPGGLIVGAWPGAVTRVWDKAGNRVDV